ncbi:MAG: EAL domain-containing protein [Gloeomargaritaceae cyanobacterium C42_A2020_066]|nr:EAL domain-containing protein [Gloeomargaritaceae cyanobacterium C42_A2020_066]
MGHSLGLEVVAEGIEHPDQLAWLQAHACDYAQGFLFGRPQPLDNFQDG